MSTLETENSDIANRAIGLIIGNDDFTVCLADGRRLTVPYACYPRLASATIWERDHFEVHADGRMLHWPDIDEDIEVQHIIEGRMPAKKNKSLMVVAENPSSYGVRIDPQSRNS